MTARYPWRTSKYRDVTYTNQDAWIKNGVLRLPHGQRGPGILHIRLPDDFQLPGRLMEARLVFGAILFVCKVTQSALPPSTVDIGVDLGVNTLLAATDGKKAVLVSGREAKSIVRYRNKSMATLDSRMSNMKPGSRRRRRLGRAKHKMLGRTKRKIRDVNHKATRIIANAFPGAHVTVGKPFNSAGERVGRINAQQVSQACNAKLIFMLAYKLAGATEVPEPYSSQTCPVCGCRQKCRRTYRCKRCGTTAPRDVVGCVNIRHIGAPELPVTMPTQVVFVRPLRKYLGPPRKRRDPGSPGGIPASSSTMARES